MKGKEQMIEYYLPHVSLACIVQTFITSQMRYYYLKLYFEEQYLTSNIECQFQLLVSNSIIFSINIYTFVIH